MSLLMEALKKAEQAKQEAASPSTEETLSLLPPDNETSNSPPEEKPSPAFPELDFAVSVTVDTSDHGHVEPALQAVEPVAMETAPPTAEPLQKESEPPPPLELSLEPAPAPPIMEKPAPEPAPTPAPAAKAIQPPPVARPPKSEAPPRPQRTDTPKQQARNVFAAKTGRPAKPALGLSKPILAVAGVGIALLLGGTGYYFYRELNPPLLAIQPVSPPVPVPQAAQAPLSTPAVPVAAAPSAATPPAPSEATAPTAQAAVPSERLPSNRTTDLTETTPERGEIRIQKGTPAEQLNPHLTTAYRALQAGNLNEAQDAYRKVLQSDRNNRDALLGLAAVQVRKGDPESAARFYQRLLELDPNDGAAQAGLTGLGEGDPVRAESRLKSLLAQQPESDALHFALGNLYAGQQRWAEAQQAYFRAFQKQPGNPDYLYNLAVSLDHLGQNKLAHDYYKKALAASERPHNFSPDEVQGRVNALEQAALRP